MGLVNFCQTRYSFFRFFLSLLSAFYPKFVIMTATTTTFVKLMLIGISLSVIN